MTMSAYVMMDFLVVAVRMLLIPVSHGRAKMELLAQSQITATSAPAQKSLMYDMWKFYIYCTLIFKFVLIGWKL